MRLDAIAIENLASLLGPQPVIDLRAGGSPVGGAGLIAITGPTGAGKSTILDAVCLALFDETPRQRGRNGDSAALLSRAAVSGRVAVDLTLDDGTPWRAEWSIRRAHQRLDGGVMPPDRRIICPRTGTILAQGASAVNELVARHLRLTVAQFRTVVLLAQGDFAAFLHADDTKRAELLTLLTGSDLYLRLGQAAHERWRTLNEACRTHDAAVAQIQVLEPAARSEIAGQITALTVASTAAHTAVATARTRQQAWSAWREAEHTAAALATAAQGARAASLAAEPERIRLAQAEVARGLEPVLMTAAQARTRAHETAQQAADAQVKVDQATVAASEARQRAGEAIALAAHAAAAQQAAAATQASVAAVTQADLAPAQAAAAAALAAQGSQHEATKAAQRAAQDLPAAQLAANAATAAQVEQVAALASAEQAVTQAEAALAAAQGDIAPEVRAARLQTLTQAVEQLATPWPDVTEAERQSIAASEARAAGEAAVTAARAAVTLAREAAQAQQAQLDRLRALGALADHRDLLVPDAPCPLCGALDHPHPIDPGTGGLIPQAAASLTALRRTVERAEIATAETERRHATAVANLDQAQRTHAERVAEVARRRARWQPVATALGLDADPVANIAVVPQLMAQAKTEAVAIQRADTARQRAVEVRDRQRETTQFAITAAATSAATVQQHQAAVARCTEALATATTAATQAQETLTSVVTALATRMGEAAPALPSIWLEAVPGRAEQARAAITAAAQAVEAATQLAAAWTAGTEATLPPAPATPGPGTPDQRVRHARTALDRLQEAQQQVAVATATAHAAHTAQQAAQAAMITAEAALAQALIGTPWPDEAAARAAILPEAARTALRTRLDQLAVAVAATTATAQAAQHQAATLHAALASHDLDPEAADDPTAGLAAALSAAEAHSATLQRDLGALRERLASDDAQRERREALVRDHAEVRQRRDRAERLRQLIGSADGARFNRCAQALTLDQLLRAANHHLLDLAPRYRLQRQAASDAAVPPLAIDVIDRDQADACRSISTLSGGETFLVSLALALALADLQRGRLRVGTLCIDEGFGSLDEQTLATAMAVLERLQQRQGTQILLISHVGALHERIAHRIEVVRRGGGASRLRLVSPDGLDDTIPPLPALAASDAADARERERLLAALATHGPQTSAQLQDILLLDAKRIRELITPLLTDGTISKEGAGRGVRYLAGVMTGGTEA
jgi:exonuclease SbcC